MTSPRVAPGILSRQAWLSLQQADAVHTANLESAMALALSDDGIRLTQLLPAPELQAPNSTPPAGYWQQVAQQLIAAAEDSHIVWVDGPDGDPGLASALTTELARHQNAPEVEVLVGSWDVPGSRLLDAVAVMERLRGQGGCAWVQAQTHESLAPYALEEAGEVTDAIAAGHPSDLAEELGDLLFQVLFHARVAAERAEPFDIDDVAGHLVNKLVRRNPHIFADAHAETLEEIEAQWQRIKAEEKAARAQQ